MGLPLTADSQFSAFGRISKHQDEATSERGPITPRGRSENAKAANARWGDTLGLPLTAGSQFSAFGSISKHQEEATSERGPKTPRGRSENAIGGHIWVERGPKTPRGRSENARGSNRGCFVGGRMMFWGWEGVY